MSYREDNLGKTQKSNQLKPTPFSPTTRPTTTQSSLPLLYTHFIDGKIQPEVIKQHIQSHTQLGEKGLEPTK